MLLKLKRLYHDPHRQEIDRRFPFRNCSGLVVTSDAGHLFADLAIHAAAHPLQAETSRVQGKAVHTIQVQNDG